MWLYCMLIFVLFYNESCVKYMSNKKKVFVGVFKAGSCPIKKTLFLSDVRKVGVFFSSLGEGRCCQMNDSELSLSNCRKIKATASISYWPFFVWPRISSSLWGWILRSNWRKINVSIVQKIFMITLISINNIIYTGLHKFSFHRDRKFGPFQSNQGPWIWSVV